MRKRPAPLAPYHKLARARYLMRILKNDLPACRYSPPRRFMSWQLKLRKLKGK